MRENMEESNNLNKPQNIDNLSDDKFNKTQDVDEILNINEDDSSKIETNLLKIKKFYRTFLSPNILYAKVVIFIYYLNLLVYNV